LVEILIWNYKEKHIKNEMREKKNQRRFLGGLTAYSARSNLKLQGKTYPKWDGKKRNRWRFFGGLTAYSARSNLKLRIRLRTLSSYITMAPVHIYVYICGYVYVCIFIYMYMYVYLHSTVRIRSRTLSSCITMAPSVCIYVHIYVHICGVYICVYMYIYIYVCISPFESAHLLAVVIVMYHHGT